MLADVLGKTTEGAVLVQEDVEMGKQEGQQHDGTNALPSLSGPQKSLETIQFSSSLLAQLLNPQSLAQLKIPPSLHAQLLAQLVNPIEAGSEGAKSGPSGSLEKPKSQKASKAKHPNVSKPTVLTRAKTPLTAKGVSTRSKMHKLPII